MKIFWENKKVLVTGGGGFIGSSAVDELLKRKAIVTVVLSKKTKKEKINRNIGNHLNKIKLENADLLSLEDCLRVTKGQEILLNFAALDGGLTFKAQYPAEIFRANTQIVLNVLEASRINKVDRILLMSSIEVYSSDVPSPIKEEYGLISNLSNERFGYAWSKRFSEIAARVYRDQYGLQIAIARVGNVYGPRDVVDEKRGRVIPTFINKAIKDEDIVIWDNGLQEKSFLYISDLISPLLDLVEMHAVCDPVNIASSEYVAIKELAKLIIELIGSKSKLVFKNLGQNKNKNKIVSTEKLRKIINFEERYSLKKGIISIKNTLF